ncbi:hypothetical protein [Pseudonocardia sp. N23]|uniref:hypothetical protein n=1 Tax=Pseudonocardia sp. N23 TaxID=1987376 RepID=UPI000C03131D|nr:hypothetical protein [Pseudonocardia sp. N23]GAY11985.1 hypothetical protein TOK_0371 [Pseudonocardia sp. N23]
MSADGSAAMTATTLADLATVTADLQGTPPPPGGGRAPGSPTITATLRGEIVKVSTVDG